MSSIQDWEWITSEIYECVSDESGWPEALQTLAIALEAESALVHLKSKLVQYEEVLADASFQDASARVRRYLNEYEPISPIFLKFRAVPTGELRALGAYAFSAAYQNTAYYQDWVRPQGWRDKIGGHLTRNNASSIWLSLRRAHDRGMFKPSQIALAQKIAPHMTRAVRLQIKLRENGLRADALVSSIDAVPFAIFLTDANAKLLIANKAGEKILQAADGLRARHSFLACDRGGENKALQDAIRSCSAPQIGEKRTKFDLTISRRGALRPLTAHVMPASSVRGRCSARLASAVIFVIDPCSALVLGETPLAAYELTPAEQRMLQAIVACPGVANAAEKLDISINTGRTHMKNIFAKTGTRNQAELVRLVLMSGLPASRTV